MSLERQAILANGVLLIASTLLAAIPVTRIVGLWTTGCLGLALIFSGVTGYCGWIRVLPLVYRFMRMCGYRSINQAE